MVPESLKYSQSHEWVGLEEVGGQPVAVVGITSFALELLTDLVFMELPAVGDEVVQGQQFGEVESVKAVSPLYSPVTGEVMAVNDNVTSKLDSLADDPYINGWLIKVRLAKPSELDNLLDAKAYASQCAK